MKKTGPCAPTTLACNANMVDMMKQDIETRAELKANRPRWSRYELAQEIRVFLDEFDMKPTPFGIAAAQDDKLLWRIENAPNGISLDKADRIRTYMTQHRDRAYGAKRTRSSKSHPVWHEGMIESDPHDDQPRNRNKTALTE